MWPPTSLEPSIFDQMKADTPRLMRTPGAKFEKMFGFVIITENKADIDTHILSRL